MYISKEVTLLDEEQDAELEALGVVHISLEEAGLEESHNQPTFDINTPHEFMDFMYDGEEEWSFAE